MDAWERGGGGGGGGGAQASFSSIPLPVCAKSTQMQRLVGSPLLDAAPVFSLHILSIMAVLTDYVIIGRLV